MTGRKKFEDVGRNGKRGLSTTTSSRLYAHFSDFTAVSGSRRTLGVVKRETRFTIPVKPI